MISVCRWQAGRRYGSQDEKPEPVRGCVDVLRRARHRTSVIALGLTAVVKASASLSDGATRDKTLLELQLGSSLEIRRALATPVAQPPPLPPITARPARDLREAAAAQTRKPPQVILPPEAMNAMAMDPSRATSPGQSWLADYAVRDRHTPTSALLATRAYFGSS